jgi:hypothetical protein
MDRQKILEAWIALGAIVNSIDPGDSDCSKETIYMTAESIRVRSESIMCEILWPIKRDGERCCTGIAVHKSNCPVVR